APCIPSIAPTNCTQAIKSDAGASVFRVGVDGSIPTPAPLGKQQIPVVPQGFLAEFLSFADDPDFKVGRNQMVDFTIQREMRGNMLLEVGFIGRYARDLLNNVNFNSSPIMFKDKVSGQTFAQAYDAMSAQVRNNQSITPQPFFEKYIPLGACNGILGVSATSSTSCLAQGDTGDFTGFNVSDLFLIMDIVRGLGAGLPTFNNLNRSEEHT